MPTIKLTSPLNIDKHGREITNYFSYSETIAEYKQFWLKKDPQRAEDLNRILEIISTDLMEKNYSEDRDGRHNCTNSKGTAHHTNHGTSHGLRQREYQLQYLALIKQRGEAQFQEAANDFTPEELEIMLLAAFMHRIGRTNELGFGNDKFYGPRAAKIFTDIASKLDFDQKLIDIVAGTMNAFRTSEAIGKQDRGEFNDFPEYDDFLKDASESTRRKLVLFERLIKMGHMTDLVRCWGPSKYQEVFSSIKESLQGLLQRGCDADALVEHFLSMAGALCKASGAPVCMLKERSALQKDLTIESALNVRTTKQKLHEIACQFQGSYLPLFQLFRCDFQDVQGKDISAYVQAEQILRKVAELHTQYPKRKVGISYSANQAQTDMIIVTYQQPGAWNTKTKGTNQARVIQEIEVLLGQSQWQYLQQVFRVIPFTTMKYDKSQNAGPADDDSVRQCLVHAEKFMNDGNLLLGWTNQLNPNNVAIGGGVAASVQPEKQKKMIQVWINDVLAKYASQHDATGLLNPPKVNKVIPHQYRYRVDAGHQRRGHRPFGIFSSWEVHPQHFSGLKKCYQNAVGDHLKTRILDDFNEQMQGCNNIESLNVLKARLIQSVEFTVLNTGQDVFMFMFGQLFGIKTSSVKALEQMFHDMQTNLSESLAR